MAIEFHCPYCTATIRVADSAAGKRGRCPKCSTKLVVPAVPAPPEENPSQPETLPSPASAGLSGLTVESPSVSERLRRESKTRTSQGKYSLVIAITCLVLIFAVIAGILHFRKPPLAGSLRGLVVTDPDVRTIRVSFDRLNLTDQERDQTASAFQKSTESFVSREMRCVVECDGQHLEIHVSPEPGAVWYSVNPATHPGLLAWIGSHRKSIDTDRRERIARVGREFCRQKIAQQQGSTKPLDAVRYRGHFALPAHVSTLGYVVMAQAGDRLVPCAHEDSNGTLYFPLLAGIDSFQLRGRSIDGDTLFPGTFHVDIDTVAPEPNGQPDEMPEPEDESAPTDEDGDWDPLKNLGEDSLTADDAA